MIRLVLDGLTKINNIAVSNNSLSNSCNTTEVSNTIVDVFDAFYAELARVTLCEDIIMNEYNATKDMTYKWVNYALDYITNCNAILISEISDDIKEFVNGIVDTVYPTFGKIYPEVGVAKVSKYDIENCGVMSPCKKFVLSLEDILSVTNDEEFIRKIQQRWVQLNQLAYSVAENNTTQQSMVQEQPHIWGQNGTSAIFMNTSENLISAELNRPKKDQRMSLEDYARMERYFANVIPTDKKYYYDMDENGNIYIAFPNVNNLATPKYLIDDGSIIGGTDISLLVGYEKPDVFGGSILDTVFVNISKLPEIFTNIMTSDSQYILSAFEVREVNETMFTNGYIYNIVDFTNTPFINNMSKNDMNKLEYVLSTILSLNDFGARLRFDKYLNPDHFVLVSDNKVNSNIPQVSSVVMDGLMFVVDNHNIIKYLRKGEPGYIYQY